MVPRWRVFATFLHSVFSASRVQHISDMHSKFALRAHHVWKYGRHPMSDRWDTAKIRRGKKKKEETTGWKYICPHSAMQGGHKSVGVRKRPYLLLRKWCHNNKHFAELLGCCIRHGGKKTAAIIDTVWRNYVTVTLYVQSTTQEAVYSYRRTIQRSMLLEYYLIR